MRFRWLGPSIVGALAWGISGVVAGCSHPAPQDRDSRDVSGSSSTKQAIQGGTADGAGHPYAVGICAGTTKGQCDGICSGALILPNVVVTARHCVYDSPERIDCEANPPIRFGPARPVGWITTHDKMFQTTIGWHRVKTIVTPPDDRFCGNDVALIVLDAPIPATEAKPVVPGVQYPMGDLERYAHTYTAVGYGKISPLDPPQSARCFTASSDYTQCPGLRRFRENIRVLCIPGDEDIPCPADPGVRDNEFIAGDGTCQGDSGSSAFETSSFSEGVPLTFGVLSRGGTSTDGATCKQSVYARLDRWRDFILQTAQTASANWTLYPKPVPDWTVFVPPKADAGAPDSGKPKPTNQPDGAACSGNEECKSKLCADTGEGKVCAQACVESAPASCADGFVCKGSVCIIAPPAPAGGTTTTTTTGCSVGASAAGMAPTDAPWRTAGIAAAIGLVLGARRRRRQ